MEELGGGGPGNRHHLLRSIAVELPGVRRDAKYFDVVFQKLLRLSGLSVFNFRSGRLTGSHGRYVLSTAVIKPDTCNVSGSLKHRRCPFGCFVVIVMSFDRRHTPSMYPLSPGAGFRSPYPSALPISTSSLPSDFYRFSPTGLIPPHPGLSPHPPHLSSHPAIVTPGPKQELPDLNHRYVVDARTVVEKRKLVAD